MMDEAIADVPISYSSGIHHQEEGVDYIPSDIELAGMDVRLTNVVGREAVLRNVLEPLKKRYDYCLIDCMPSLGMLTIGALAASDSVLIPVQAQHFPLKGLIALVKNIQMVRRRINPKLSINGIVMTMVDSLSAAADARCESFVAGGPFDHSGMTTTSEICAKGPLESASAVCSAWQSSPDHYANIMNASFTSMGVGCWFCDVDGARYTYWVVTFS